MWFASAATARWKSAKRRCADRKRGEQLRVTVALDDLGRRRLGLEAEPLAGNALDLRFDRRIVADNARQLADPHAFERLLDAGAGPIELECPDRELEAERRRLGVDAVCSADRQCEPMLLRPGNHGGERATDAFEDQLARGSKLQREPRVHDVRGRESVVEPTARRAELCRHGVDERGQVVLCLLLDLCDAGRGRRSRPRPDLLCRLGGYRPDLCPGGEGRELDFEPPLELALVRPDPGHGRARITSDH